MSFDQIFIEQAEYLEGDSLKSWHAEHPNEDSILRKLTQGGAKLISGPRGCGKTTLLLRAHDMMIADATAAFPIYVNYKRSLSIEPLYKSGQNGTFWFSQWIILKIYEGLNETLKKLDIKVDLSVESGKAREAASLLEMSKVTETNAPTVSVVSLMADIELALSASNRNRCVLLLDDAAHAFSPDQQRDFFDFFRQIKTKNISPKAAVYPGVTSYSPSFHVGHDAEQIDVLIKPDSASYLPFMRKILENRFPPNIENKIQSNPDVIDLLCFASFGIPRALLNMLQALIQTDENTDDINSIDIDLSRAEIIKAIKLHYTNTKKLFLSLKAKLPVYKNFVESGEQIISNSILLIKQYNKEKLLDKQSVSIAIAERDFSPELTRVFSLFQYAGLCIPKEESISRGEKGRFKLFVMHYAGLIDGNALLGARSLNIGNYVAAFKSRDAHEFTRSKPEPLYGNVEHSVAFSLSLPPCMACRAPRAFAEAKFCMNCGAPLSTPSTYRDLINRDIGELTLTDKRIKKIKEQSSIRRIKDILLDADHSELLKVDRIGRVWASKITALAEEFVE